MNHEGMLRALQLETETRMGKKRKGIKQGRNVPQGKKSHPSLYDIYPRPHGGEERDTTDEQKVLHKLEKHKAEPHVHFIVDNSS